MGMTSYGCSLASSTTIGGTYTKIAELVDIKGPKPKVPMADVSHLESTDAVKEKKPKMIEPGECMFTINYTKAQYDILIDLLYARTLMYWKVLIPDATTPSQSIFAAYVGEMPITIPADDKIACDDVMLEVTGKVAYTAGS
jgi:hypothetical protein